MDSVQVEKQWRVSAVAKLLGKDVRELRKRIKRKEIRVIKLSARGTRIPDSEVKRIIQEAAAAAQPATT